MAGTQDCSLSHWRMTTLVFFFSSRRRHTRCYRDWSSDVCSSDLAQLRLERFNLPVVACGVGTNAEIAVRAIKSGAKEYIPLPPDPELIAAVLAAVAEESASLIHRDPAMADVVRLADQVAPSAASILITGESGTGKA